jgi:hypothetical protein
VVSSTVRGAGSHLASAFRDSFKPSPLQPPGQRQAAARHPILLKEFDNVNAAPNRQRAVTPKFLEALYHYSRTAFPVDSPYRHANDLLIGACFFAMRSCEHSIAPTAGHTK